MQRLGTPTSQLRAPLVLRDPAKARERDEMLLARRRAHQAPDKLRYPGLTGGLVAGSGAFFPQGHVRSGGREGLFDDIVGPGWCVVASGPEVLGRLTASHRKALEAIGGRIAVVGGPDSATKLDDIDAIYAAWFASHACTAAVVRPDWYVYGIAGEGGELAALLDRLGQSLLREAVPAS